MKTTPLLVLLAGFLFVLNGCTTIVDATTNKPIESAKDERSPGTYIDDRRLEVIVGVNIRKADPALRQSNIDITSFNGVVLITGQTKSEALKNLATATASKLSQVKTIHNELKVRENLSFASRSNDTWLASKVRITLLADREVRTSKIKTIVEDGTVFFMGYVTTQEADRIANITSNIRGIREVVKVFEYIN